MSMIATFDNDLEEVKLVGDRTATLNSEDDEEEHSGNELCPKVEDNETSNFTASEVMTWYVWLAAAMAALGGILFGYDVGIISGALLQLKCDFDMTLTEREWVISSMLVGAIVASLTGGFLIDFVGRRATIIANSCIFIVGAIILATAHTYSVLVIGRLIVGFGVSLSAIAECIYISEIAPVSRRGMLVSLNEFGITAGFLLAYLANFVFINVDSGWRYMFGLSAIPSTIQGIGMLKLPLSPRYLVLRNQNEKARMVLQKLRGTLDVQKELDSIKSILVSQQKTSVLMLFMPNQNMRYRMFIAVSLILLQQFTGQPNVLYYASTIFEQIGFSSDVAAARGTFFLGLTKVAAATVALLFVDRAGRRKFILVGAIGMMISVGSMGIALAHAGIQKPVEKLCTETNTTMASFANTTEGSGIPDAAKFTSLIGLLMFVAFYGIGFGPVTWIILSEIFPVELRGRAFAIATVANWSSNLIVSATFLDIFRTFGVAATFLMYASTCLISVLFIFVFVPETKNRSLEQITSQLGSKHPSLVRKCRELCCGDNRKSYLGITSLGNSKSV
ncbi:solute carrier family 2, facilitated glucose transporter member 12-like [Corticium candelabrum]|uniref:solute carrier family 2, facilitated glucose transporter member 12-like n=1 Tax=Corticium candelabrum TaxID=121492 RepID=UPI002E25F022|nr:solute carrier family 2, facilitated glucose transporter member 12-like [Corticium candelabrum]